MANEEGAEVEMEMEESKDDAFANIKMDLFDEKIFGVKQTAFFSYQEPKYIFAKLQDALSNFDAESKRDENKWKMTFKIEKKLTDEEKENKIRPEACSVTVKLLRCDADKVCCEFNRSTGSSWYFYEIVNQLKQQLKDLNDACM